MARQTSKEDGKYMYLNIHKDYFDVINDNWKACWSEANSKTKCPDYNKYTYILKFATLRSKEYYTLRAARWGDPHEADANMQENGLRRPPSRAICDDPPSRAICDDDVFFGSCQLEGKAPLTPCTDKKCDWILIRCFMHSFF